MMMPPARAPPTAPPNAADDSSCHPASTCDFPDDPGVAEAPDDSAAAAVAEAAPVDSAFADDVAAIELADVVLFERLNTSVAETDSLPSNMRIAYTPSFSELSGVQ